MLVYDRIVCITENGVGILGMQNVIAQAVIQHLCLDKTPHEIFTDIGHSYTKGTTVQHSYSPEAMLA